MLKRSHKKRKGESRQKIERMQMKHRLQRLKLLARGRITQEQIKDSWEFKKQQKKIIKKGEMG